MPLYNGYCVNGTKDPRCVTFPLPDMVMDFAGEPVVYWLEFVPYFDVEVDVKVLLTALNVPCVEVLASKKKPSEPPPEADNWQFSQSRAIVWLVARS